MESAKKMESMKSMNMAGQSQGNPIDNDYYSVFRGLPQNDTPANDQLIEFFNHHTEYSLANMPAMASELTIAFGFPNMLDFFRENCAAKVHVNPQCKFFAELGIDSQKDACDRIIKLVDGDGYVYLPSASGIFQALKRAAIHATLKRSTRRHEIARFFGISSRQLRKL
jgi:hypothetical protein